MSWMRSPAACWCLVIQRVLKRHLWNKVEFHSNCVTILKWPIMTLTPLYLCWQEHHRSFICNWRVQVSNFCIWWARLANSWTANADLMEFPVCIGIFRARCLLGPRFLRVYLSLLVYYSHFPKIPVSCLNSVSRRENIKMSFSR